MNMTRMAILGTLSDLHLQPIRYDLAELGRIIAEVQPDLLGVEVEREEFERGDLSRARVDVREALVPVARRTDTVVVPLGAGSGEELRASGEGLPAALIRGLDVTLTGVQKTANDARRVNSGLVNHACGLICHLEEQICGEGGRRAWELTNEKILANILGMVRRDPGARILVAVQCRRKHRLEPKMRQRPEVELVNYWEL
jgi:hypothetical protein